METQELLDKTKVVAVELLHLPRTVRLGRYGVRSYYLRSTKGSLNGIQKHQQDRDHFECLGSLTGDETDF